METQHTDQQWFSHIVPVLTALIAIVMLVLTPIWAIRVYRQPFIGALLEPNNVVSIITGDAWPAAAAGSVRRPAAGRAGRRR